MIRTGNSIRLILVNSTKVAASKERVLKVVHSIEQSNETELKTVWQSELYLALHGTDIPIDVSMMSQWE